MHSIRWLMFRAALGHASVSSRLVVACVIVSVFPTFQAWGTTHFIRTGGAGDGSSWASAWGDLNNIAWNSLSPGDTVCIAGGTYSGAISTGKSGTAGNPITIKRATASDAICGSSTSGWNTAYDAQVILGNAGISIQHSYVTIDGMVDSGIYGTMNNGDNCYICANSGSMTGVTIAHIEVSGPCSSSGCNQNSDSRSLSLAGSSTGINWLVSHDNFHGSCTNMIVVNAVNLIVEHTRFADSIDTTPGNPNCHPNVFEVFGGTITFRYNEVTNWEVEGILICPNGNCTSSVAAYGNVFHDPHNSGVARVMETQGPGTNGPHVLYNNTIVGVPLDSARTANGGVYASGSAAYNNLLIGNSFSSCAGMPTADYEASDGSTGEAHGQTVTSAIFANYAAKTIAGYHLSGATIVGLNLGSPYDIDYDGNTRATWDRGAFEYQSGLGSPPPPPPPSGPPPPSAPRNLTTSVR